MDLLANEPDEMYVDFNELCEIIKNQLENINLN